MIRERKITRHGAWWSWHLFTTGTWSLNATLDITDWALFVSAQSGPIGFSLFLGRTS